MGSSADLNSTVRVQCNSKYYQHISQLLMAPYQNRAVKIRLRVEMERILRRIRKRQTNRKVLPGHVGGRRLFSEMLNIVLWSPPLFTADRARNAPKLRDSTDKSVTLIRVSCRLGNRKVSLQLSSPVGVG